MAKIKLQNNKVILKSNKASCSCCSQNNCDGPLSFNLTDPNVFEITRQKYNQYYNGGTWEVSISLDVDMNAVYDRGLGSRQTQTGSASLQETFTIERLRPGCRYDDPVILRRLGQHQYELISSDGRNFTSSGPMTTFVTFIVQIKSVNRRYYVRYRTQLIVNTQLTWSGSNNKGFLEINSNSTLPTQIQSVVDGNNIFVYKAGGENFAPDTPFPFPVSRIVPWTTYNETSSATLNATFTPA